MKGMGLYFFINDDKLNNILVLFVSIGCCFGNRLL
jgi:hypothetical protein